MSTSRIQRDEHVDGRDARAVHERSRDSVAMRTNTQENFCFVARFFFFDLLTFLFFVQEDEERALGNMPQEEEPGKVEEEDEAAGSDTSSEKFGFGFSGVKGAKTQPNQQKERKRKAGDDTEKAEKPKKEKAEKSASSWESGAKTKAASFKKLFDELQLMPIWKGSIKMKDVDSKVDKALQVGQQLQAAADQAVQSQGDELVSQVEKVSAKIDTLVDLSKMHYNIACQGIQDDSLELSLEGVDRVNNLPQDCIQAIATDFGETLAKARQRMVRSETFWFYYRLSIDRSYRHRHRFVYCSVYHSDILPGVFPAEGRRHLLEISFSVSV